MARMIDKKDGSVVRTWCPLCRENTLHIKRTMKDGGHFQYFECERCGILHTIPEP